MNRKRIRLTESALHRIIKESVKRILSENSFDEYDWDLYNRYPEVKDEDNEDSWNEKAYKDNRARRFTDPNDSYDIDDYTEDNDYEGSYDDGVSSFGGIGRDVNDEYFNDSDYRFTHNGWDDELTDYHTDFDENPDEFYDPDSSLNRHYVR